MAPRTAKAKKEVTSAMLSGKKMLGRKITKNEEESVEVKLMSAKKTEDYKNQEIYNSNENGKLDIEIQNENKEMPTRARTRKQQFKTVILEDHQENVGTKDIMNEGVNRHKDKPVPKARGKKAADKIKNLPYKLTSGQENGDNNDHNGINSNSEKEKSAPNQRSRKGQKKNANENLDEDNGSVKNAKEEILITTARGKKVQKKNENSRDNKMLETDAETTAQKVMTDGRSKKGNMKAKIDKLEDEFMNVDDIEAVEISSQENGKPKGRGKKTNKKDIAVAEDIVSHSTNSAEKTKQVEGPIAKIERANKTKATVQSDEESLRNLKNYDKTNEADNSKPKGRKPRKKMVAEDIEMLEEIKKATVNIAPTQVTTLNDDDDIIEKGRVKGKKPRRDGDANELHATSDSSEDNAIKQPLSNDTKEHNTNNSVTDASENATAPTNAEPQPKQAAKGKRSAPKKTTVKETANDESQEVQEPPSKKRKEKKPLKNKAVTVYEDIDFSNSSKNSQGQPWNLKICSWNVDGIRAWLTKGGLDYLKHEKPDILCLQEVKCSKNKIPAEAVDVPGYHPYWMCSDKEGYSGVAVYTIKMAFNIQHGIRDKELDAEGRIMTIEYEQFYLICTYVPNAGRNLITLPKRLRWNEIFHNYVKELDAKKPVIICGDMNVAHNEIDLANPKTNKKNAGFTEEERAGMTKLLNDGFVDTFRHLYPEKTGAYTFWTYMMNSREKNVGWRLDYFIVSERLLPALCDNVIRSEVFGSDHCPLALFLHLSGVPVIPPEYLKK